MGVTEYTTWQQLKKHSEQIEALPARIRAESGKSKPKSDRMPKCSQKQYFQ